MPKKNKLKMSIDDDNNGLSDDEMPSFSDPEGFVDDITDEDLLGDILETKPRETDGVQSVIIVDGIPKVGLARLDKLKNVIRKNFKEFGTIVNECCPMENETTKGYMFIEFSDPQSAQKAVAKMNGHKLDKQHTFLCNMFTDFEKYANIPEEYTPPEPQPYKDVGNLYNFLTEENCFDQYCIMYDDGLKSAIYSNSVPEPTLLEEKKSRECYVKWSPLGTYFATVYNQSVVLWGGEKFQKVQEFQHPELQFVDFSPKEKYIITFSHMMKNHRTEPNSLIIWDVLTGQKKRAFDVKGGSKWPVFKWSYDDKYFARIGEDMLSVYETPDFGLLDKKSLKVTGIKDFSWSPTDNILAYWIAEDKDVPAKVCLITIPHREEVRPKNLFSVSDCKMHWQKGGDYLCVKVERYAKAKREKNEVKYAGSYYNLEIFHMREKGIPVDSLEIKENLFAFAWEPVNSKFGIISGEPSNASVTFFQVNRGVAPTELKKLDKRSCTTMSWSPNGQFVILGDLGRPMNAGSLEFIDTKDFATMANGEHFMVNEIEWDPTGRYIMSCVSSLEEDLDSAYWIWSFQGKCLYKHQIDKLLQFQWRPRPPTPLTYQDIKDLKKNLKKYSGTFELEDKKRYSQANKEIIEKRQKQKDEFLVIRKMGQERYEKEAAERLALRGGVDITNMEVEEEIFECLIKREVTEVEE